MTSANICCSDQKYGITWYLTNFATMRKSEDNYYFCSDLLLWAKLLDNDFWSHLLHWAKMWKIATSIEFSIECKSIQKFAFDRNCPFDKCQFQNQGCHPCKCLEKVKACFYTPGKLWGKCGVYHLCHQCKIMANLILRHLAKLSKCDICRWFALNLLYR